jgi:hypothetical protein
MSRQKSYFLHDLFSGWQQQVSKLLLVAAVGFCLLVQPAFAGINDDLYDGNIFVIYAGNGSLVPSRQTLADALAQKKPAVLLFYIDDSSDCKQYAIVGSQIQAFYGRVTEIIPVDVDTIPVKSKYEPTEVGYYYSGGVPQVVILDQQGKVVLNKKGQVPYEEIDDQFRKVFDLLPRTESPELKRRSFNEFSSELSK